MPTKTRTKARKVQVRKPPAVSDEGPKTREERLQHREWEKLSEKNRNLEGEVEELKLTLHKLEEKFREKETENLRMTRRFEALGHEKGMSVLLSAAAVPNIKLYGVWSPHDMQKVYRLMLQEMRLHARRLAQSKEEVNTDPLAEREKFVKVTVPEQYSLDEDSKE